MDVGKLNKEQPALQLGLHIVTLARLHAVPLVQRDDQRSAAFQHETKQIQIVFDHAFTRIHDEDDHVRVLDRLQRLDHRELFHGLEDLAAATHTSRIDQGVLFVVAFERDVDAVAGGTGLVIDNDPLLAKHAVDQRRLAHVGPADDRDLDAILFARPWDALQFLAFGDRLALFTFAFGNFGVVLGEHAERLLQHMADPAAMGGGNRQSVTKTQRTEFRAGDIGINAVDLVRHEKVALVHLAQVFGNHLIARRHASTRIDHEHDSIGLLHGLQGLLRHLGVDAFLIPCQTTGIDDDVGATLPLGLAILAITGQTGIFRHDGVTALGQTVKQGGLANVRAAHQGDYGNHTALHCDISENTKAAARQRPDIYCSA